MYNTSVGQPGVGFPEPALQECLIAAVGSWLLKKKRKNPKQDERRHSSEKCHVMCNILGLEKISL